MFVRIRILDILRFIYIGVFKLRFRSSLGHIAYDKKILYLISQDYCVRFRKFAVV